MELDNISQSSEQKPKVSWRLPVDPSLAITDVEIQNHTTAAWTKKRTSFDINRQSLTPIRAWNVPVRQNPKFIRQKELELERQNSINRQLDITSADRNNYSTITNQRENMMHQQKRNGVRTREQYRKNNNYSLQLPSVEFQQNQRLIKSRGGTAAPNSEQTDNEQTVSQKVAEITSNFTSSVEASKVNSFATKKTYQPLKTANIKQKMQLTPLKYNGKNQDAQQLIQIATEQHQKLRAKSTKKYGRNPTVIVIHQHLHQHPFKSHKNGSVPPKIHQNLMTSPFNTTKKVIMRNNQDIVEALPVRKPSKRKPSIDQYSQGMQLFSQETSEEILNAYSPQGSQSPREEQHFPIQKCAVKSYQKPQLSTFHYQKQRVDNRNKVVVSSVSFGPSPQHYTGPGTGVSSPPDWQNGAVAQIGAVAQAQPAVGPPQQQSSRMPRKKETSAEQLQQLQEASVTFNNAELNLSEDEEYLDQIKKDNHSSKDCLPQTKLKRKKFKRNVIPHQNSDLKLVESRINNPEQRPAFMFQNGSASPFIAVSAGQDQAKFVAQLQQSELRGKSVQRESRNSSLGDADFTIDRDSLSPRYRRAILPFSNPRVGANSPEQIIQGQGPKLEKLDPVIEKRKGRKSKNRVTPQLEKTKTLKNPENCEEENLGNIVLNKYDSCFSNDKKRSRSSIAASSTQFRRGVQFRKENNKQKYPHLAEKSNNEIYKSGKKLSILADLIKQM